MAKRVASKVEYDRLSFSISRTQASPNPLEVSSKRSCRSEINSAFDAWHVESFIDEIAGNESLEYPCSKIPNNIGSLFLSQRAVDGDSVNSTFSESCRNFFNMRAADAKADELSPVGVFFVGFNGISRDGRSV